MPPVPFDLALVHFVVVVRFAHLAVHYYDIELVHVEQFLVLPGQVVVGQREILIATIPRIVG